MDAIDQIIQAYEQIQKAAYLHATTPMTLEQKKRLLTEKKAIMKRHRKPKPPRVPPEQFGLTWIRCYDCGYNYAPCRKNNYSCPYCNGHEETEDLPF